MAKPRILIIEDERALTNVLEYNLKREGYETIVAHDGQEGLRKAKTQPVDLILLDLMLPTLDGKDVCRELRANEATRDIPIVILTGSHEERDIASSHDLGANRFIVKPITFKQLTVAARQLGLHRLVGDEPPGR